MSSQYHEKTIDYGKMFIHVAVSLFFGLAYVDLGIVMKIIFIPYLYYILFNRRAENIPAIVILMCFGTILTILMGILLIPYCHRYRDKLNNRFWRILHSFLLFMAPFYIITTVLRIVNGMNVIESVTMNDYYIAFWFALFGVINKEYFNVKLLSQFLGFGIILSFFIFLFQDIGSFNALKRISNYFDITLLVLLVNNLFSSKLKYKNVSIIACFLVLRNVIFGIEYKFTFILSLLLALISLGLWHKQKHKNIRSLIFSTKYYLRFLIVLPFVFLSLTIYLTPTYAREFSNTEVDYNLSNNLIDQILSKTFTDRGVIWTGSLAGIIENTNVLLPLENPKIVYETHSGKEFVVNFESHNLILSLIKYNGYLFGCCLILIYLKIMYQIFKTLTHYRGIHAIYVVSLFGIGIAVFITGQYTLQLTTSFLFMTLNGGLISYNDMIRSNLTRER